MITFYDDLSFYTKRLKDEFQLSDRSRTLPLSKGRRESYDRLMEKMVPAFVGLLVATQRDTRSAFQEAFKRFKTTQGLMYPLLSKKETTNEQAATHVLKLTSYLEDLLYVQRDELDLADWVENKELQRFPRDVLSFVATKFKASREVTVLELGMGEGDGLLAFKKGIKTDHGVIAYGSDKSVDACDAAREKGVDHVAKQGIDRITPHCIDLSYCFKDGSSTVISEKVEKEDSDGNKYIGYSSRLEFRPGALSLLYQKIPADDGYVLFNFPSFEIPNFVTYANQSLVIDDLYRVDDAMQNVLVVARKRKNKGENEAKLRKAMLMYDRLPPLSEMKEYYINKGSVHTPDIFKPKFIDEEDMLREFTSHTAPSHVLEGYYAPVERITELSNPLQEIKEGHFPAVATSEIINGINDTAFLAPILGKDLGFTHLFCTKVIQQEVEEQATVMHNGKEVEEFSEKKMNFIVSNAWTQDGELIELLDTENKNIKETC